MLNVQTSSELEAALEMCEQQEELVRADAILPKAVEVSSEALDSAKRASHPMLAFTAQETGNTLLNLRQSRLAMTGNIHITEELPPPPGCLL
jgi:hypothetical protein